MIALLSLINCKDAPLYCSLYSIQTGTDFCAVHAGSLPCISLYVLNKAINSIV